MPVFKTSRDKPRFTFGVKGEVSMPSREAPVPSTSNKKRISTPMITEQSGTRKDILRDAARKALLPGKRISRTGKVYWETRKNRSDKFRSNL